MAVLGEIVKLNNEHIKTRNGFVVGDVVIEKEYLQLRTYAMGDVERDRGSKQNIQFNKDSAKEFRDLLNIFLEE